MEIGYLPMNREHRGAQQSLLERWGQRFAMASTLTAAPLDRLLHPLAHRAHCRGGKLSLEASTTGTHIARLLAGSSGMNVGATARNQTRCGVPCYGQATPCLRYEPMRRYPCPRVTPDCLERRSR